MKLRRITALCLALLMLLAIIPSCGAKNSQEKLTNVFKETLFRLPEKYSDNENFNINNLYRSGDKLYAHCYSYDDSAGGREQQFLIPITAEGTFGDEIGLELEQSENGGMYIQSLTFSDDGTFWAMIESYNYDEETGYQQENLIRHYTDPASGRFDVIKLDNMVDEETGESYYINYLIPLENDTILTASWNKIKLLTPDKGFTDVDLGIESDDFNVENIIELNGKIYISIYSYGEGMGKNQTYLFDESTGKLGDEVELSSQRVDSYSMIAGPGYDFYYRDQTAVWGCDIASGEKTEVMNFINSDINSNYINRIIPLSADKFVASSYDPEDGLSVVAMYDRIPDDQVAKREIISLAVPYLQYNIHEEVIKFNKSNDKYRIVVNDYSVYNTDEDYNAGQTRLNSDIVSGKLPDILLINSEMPYDSYVAQGLFTDLYKLMDEDADFDRSRYLENIFKAYEIDGKLYSLVPSFQIQTFAAKTSLLGGMKHWTTDEFMSFAKAHPELQIFDYNFNRQSFLELMMVFTRDSFIDRETGSCRFDSDEFRKLLEFAKTLNVDDFWSSVDSGDSGPEFWNEYDNRFKEDRVLLSSAYIYNVGDSYKSLLNYTFNDEFSFIGFPSDNGNGSMITADMELAISRRSKVKEGAWEFIKTFISEDAQMPKKSKWGYWEYTDGLPILRAALDKSVEIAMTPPEESEFDYGITIPDGPIAIETAVPAEATADDTMASVETQTAETQEEETRTDETQAAEEIVSAISSVAPIVGAKYVNPYNIPLSEAQADQLREVIEGTTQVMRYDTKLNTIISEEAEAFFSGQKSLDEVVTIIQNRAETYIAENR